MEHFKEVIFQSSYSIHHSSQGFCRLCYYHSEIDARKIIEILRDITILPMVLIKKRILLLQLHCLYCLELKSVQMEFSMVKHRKSAGSIDLVGRTRDEFILVSMH